MADTTTSIDIPSSTLATRELHDFFTRLSAGDYHNLAKELGIDGKPTTPLPTTLMADVNLDAFNEEENSTILNSSTLSNDSVESFRFQPTAEGLQRAVTLLRGDNPRPPTPEEEEAFQFTFRLMIHKLYSIKDFASMVEDVVRISQERFRPLPPDLTNHRRRRESRSFSFAYHDDGDSLGSVPLASPTDSSSLLPSSPASSAWAPSPQLCGPRFDTDEEMRAVKKRIVGRKLSVIDTSVDEELAESPSWVYDATVASVDSPTSYFNEPFLPVRTSSPVHLAYAEDIDAGSRKRRYSFFAARGL